MNPPIKVILLFFSLQFFCLGFLFGNLRAIAMEPVGHIAGIGAAITGFISTLMAVPISIVIGKFVRLTVLPIFHWIFDLFIYLSLLIVIDSNNKGTSKKTSLKNGNTPSLSRLLPRKLIG